MTTDRSGRQNDQADSMDVIGPHKCHAWTRVANCTAIEGDVGDLRRLRG